MFVCHCKKVTCKEIKQAIHDNCDIETIAELTKACTCCQKCKEDIIDLINEKQNEKKP